MVGIFAFAAAFFLALVAVIVFRSRGAVLRQRRFMSQWRPLLEARVGRMREPKSRTSAVHGEVVASHVVVRLEWTPEDIRNGNQELVGVSADFVYGEGPKFQLEPRLTQLVPFVDKLRAPTVPFGDAPFDHEYVLRCDDAQATRHALTPAARKLLLSFRVRPKVHSNGREVSVEVRGSPGASPTLESLVDLVGELASFGAHDVAKYASLPDVELYPPSVEPVARFRCVASTKAGQIELCINGGGMPGLALHLPHPRSLPSFETRPERGVDLPAELVTDEVAALATSLEDATLANRVTADARMLVIEWPGLPDERDVLRGVELLTAIVAPQQSTGAFR